MKNLLTATLPALALLALGGCATSGALVNPTESDGVYYSSQDKTTANGSLNSVYSNRGYNQNQSVAGSANPDGFAYGQATGVNGTPTAPAATTDDANPDYVAGTGNATQGYNTSTLGGSSDYYANSLSNSASGFGVPYNGPGVSTYNYAPVTSAYYGGSPYGYGGFGGFGSPYSYGGFGGFGSPYGYGGFGSPYGYGGFYDPFYSSFYSPFGFGYGSGLSIGYGFGFGGFGGYGYPFGGYYGYNPYRSYGYGGYGGYGYGSAVGAYGDNRGNVNYGPRGGRGGMVLNAQPNGVVGGNNGPVNVGAGRRGSGMVLGANGMAAPASPAAIGGSQPSMGRGAFSNSAMGQPTVATPGTMPNGASAAGRRGGFFGGFFGGNNASGQRAQMGQQQANGGFGQPQQRSYSQPQQQRSFSQPSRSFSQPSFSQPSRSFSQPSFGGGGGGGGGFGGGGGGGGRRGGR